MSLEEKVKELAERVNRIEKEKEDLKEENKDLKRQINQLKSFQNFETGNKTSETQISRRSFLKKLGAGAIGLGALSLAPAASKVTISDTGISKDGVSALWSDGTSSLSSSLDFNQQEAGQLVLDQVEGDASGAVTGQIWYDTNAD